MKFVQVEEKVILNINTFAKQGKIIIEVTGQNPKLLTLALYVIKYKLTIKSFIYNQKFR